MSQFYRANPSCDSDRFARRTSHAAILCSLGLVLLFAGVSHAAAVQRVAVAPFAGEVDALAVAIGLASELAERNLERLIAPGEFVAENSFEPRAADVRRWAYNSSVDAIIVGRVYSVGKVGRQTRVVETVVRSGHSGAELSRHEVSLASDAKLDQSLETLALSILAGLGHKKPLQEANPPSGDPADAAGRGAGAHPAAAQVAPADGSGQGLESELSASGFRSDAPIEIKAEEAEIINRDNGRRLIFQRNVVVTQANVSLRSDRLEALYRKGESEPRELLAEGRVSIDQGDRRAKCDRAIYQREANSLICQGRAELIQGCDIVRGETIEFDLAGDKARVEGAASIVIRPESDIPTDCSPAQGSL